MLNKNRPKFLNLFVLAPKMSVMAKVSILHRLSGVILSLSIPGLLWVLHNSLISQSFYDTLYACCSSTLVKLIYLLLIWGFMHHICAGIRFLFLDVHKGVNKKIAINSARLVMVISLSFTILLGILVW